MTTRERWPKAPEYEGHPFGPWWCGRCGGCHGWDCPYDIRVFPNGGGDERMAKDKAAHEGPFQYGPYPGGEIKQTTGDRS